VIQVGAPRKRGRVPLKKQIIIMNHSKTMIKQIKKRNRVLSDSDRIKNTIVERAIFTNECLTDTDWGYLLDRALLNEYTHYEELLSLYYDSDTMTDYEYWYDVVEAHSACVVLYNYLKKIWPDEAEAYKSTCDLSPLPADLYNYHVKECPWLETYKLRVTR
jgi:hypothetical protein